MSKICVLLLLIFSTVNFSFAGEVLTEKSKIQLLLDRVEKSGLIFERNGSSYSSVEAREHLEKKLNYVGDKIDTAGKFIKYIASKSSFSGRKYYIIKKNGERVTAEKWLNDQLKKIIDNNKTK